MDPHALEQSAPEEMHSVSGSELEALHQERRELLELKATLLEALQALHAAHRAQLHDVSACVPCEKHRKAVVAADKTVSLAKPAPPLKCEAIGCGWDGAEPGYINDGDFDQECSECHGAGEHVFCDMCGEPWDGVCTKGCP